MISLTLPIEPVAKGRPRFGRGGRIYTPNETVRFENAVRSQIQIRRPETYQSGALVVWIDFLIVPPKKTLRRHPSVRPDIDNYTKAVCDAANGILWKDDGQIVELHVRKLYDWTERKGSIRIIVDQVKGEK